MPLMPTAAAVPMMVAATDAISATDRVTHRDFRIKSFWNRVTYHW